MKHKYVLFLFVVLFSLKKTKAQQFRSPSFDSIYIGGIDRIWNWIPTDGAIVGSTANGDTIGPQQSNALFNQGQGHMLFGTVDIYNSSPYSPVCAKLNTTNYKKNNGAPFDTYLINGRHYYTGSDGYIDFSKGGVPFTYRPDSLTGYYQYIDSNLATTDYGICIFLLKKYNSVTNTSDTIAYQVDSLSFGSSTWSRFSFPINYLSNAQPDTMITIFKASTRPLETSSFWLDNLEFIYGPNAIHPISKTKQFPILYPNPNTGVVHIDEKEFMLTHYQLIDIQGKILEQAAHKKEVLLPQSSTNLFYLKLFDKNGLVKSYKILKK